MSLLPGTRLGVYEVVAKLGEGGMGEVYRARDTKLDRDVALKILPESFASDPDRLMRFEREAKTLASLNHPHIAAIYGFESNPAEAGHHIGADVVSGFSRTTALVMELVEGEDLSTRIARGPIPLDEALPIAQQIAEALEAAHEQGIIHRDLKPANVKVRSDGTVKVLDFGLAKAAERSPNAEASALQTITSPAVTMQGVILGTAAYMSPEQAKGKPVDRRADIWAFGCVLYEMLTGKRTFAGEDISDTLVSVLRDDPRWAALPSGTPPQVRTLLRRCLQKDPQKRLPHIGTARLDLTEGGPVDAAELLPPRSGRVGAATVGAVIGALVVAAIAFGVMRPAEAPGARTPVRFSIEPQPGAFFPGGDQVPRFAVSPDGTMVVYQQQDSSASQLWIRSLESIQSRSLPATVSTTPGGLSHQQPFWSPDGRYIAYFDERASQVKKLDRQTGSVQTLGEIKGNQLSGSWNDAGVILISSVGSRGVQRLPDAGGAPVPVTTLDPATQESAHLWPEFLPDGKHFVYLATFANDMESAVFVGSLDGASPKRLFASTAMARVAWPNRLLFVRDGALVSQQFDLERLELIGEPNVIVNDIPVTTAGRVGVSASRTGVLVHSAGRVGTDASESAWVDRAGRAVQPAPPSVDVGISGIRLSRDGRRLTYGRTAIERSGRRLNEVWIQDTQRGIESRLSTDLALAGPPAVFSSDGGHVWFRRAGDSVAIVRQAISGAVPAEAVVALTAIQLGLPLDVLPDGRLLFSLGETSRVGGDSRMLVMPPGPAQTPVPYLNSLAGLYGAAFSPDGRWVAYAVGSTMNNRQVFIQPFPDAAGGKWPVSGEGGGYPRWRADGRELYFVDSNRRLTAVAVSTRSGLDIGAPTVLFQLDPQNNPNPYDVSPDGQRFVILRNKGLGGTPSRLIVTVNWLHAIDTLDAGVRQ